MKRSRKTRKSLRRPFSAAERTRRWRKRHPAKHRKQQRRAYQRRRERQNKLADQATLRERESDRQRQAEIQRQNAELQRKQQADAGFTEEERETLKKAFADHPELLQLHFPAGEALAPTPSAATALPPPQHDPRNEQDQLLQERLRLDRLRATTQEAQRSRNLRQAVAARSRF